MFLKSRTTERTAEFRVSEPVTYYAIVRGGGGLDSASGLVRRRATSQGRADESLTRDLGWQASSALFEWETGDASGRELIEISAAEAERLIERFRVAWGTAG
jgi:hypothetical protein